MKYVTELAMFVCSFGLPKMVFGQSTAVSDTFYVRIPKNLPKEFEVIDEKQTREQNATARVFGAFTSVPYVEQLFFL